MVNPDDSIEQLNAVKVVHGEYCRPLVLVAEKCKALALAGLTVSNQVDVHHLAVLRENRYYVTLAQIKTEAADEDPGAVFVHVMPAGLSIDDAQLQLLLAELGDVPHIAKEKSGVLVFQKAAIINTANLRQWIHDLVVYSE